MIFCRHRAIVHEREDPERENVSFWRCVRCGGIVRKPYAILDPISQIIKISNALHARSISMSANTVIITKETKQALEEMLRTDLSMIPTREIDYDVVEDDTL